MVACVPFLVLHRQKGCQGFRSWAYNATFSVSLLFLFMDFSRRTYRAKCAALCSCCVLAVWLSARPRLLCVVEELRERARRCSDRVLQEGEGAGGRGGEQEEEMIAGPMEAARAEEGVGTGLAHSHVSFGMFLTCVAGARPGKKRQELGWERRAAAAARKAGGCSAYSVGRQEQEESRRTAAGGAGGESDGSGGGFFVPPPLFSPP